MSKKWKKLRIEGSQQEQASGVQEDPPEKCVMDFHHIKVNPDTWQKIACHAKYADLFLAVEPYNKIKVGDIIVFDDKTNPYPKCICRAVGVRWFKGFKSAFNSVPTASLGYIMGEQMRADYRDFENNYAINAIKEHGALSIMWKLLSCEYVKYTPDTAYDNVQRRSDKDFEVEPDVIVKEVIEEPTEEEAEQNDGPTVSGEIA